MAFLTSVAGTGTAQYFADENGLPYMIRWDSLWGMIVSAGNSGGATTWQSDMDGYCAARAGQGFNGFLTTPVATSPQITGANVNGSTWDGVAPFTSPGVLNDTFWQRVDYLLASAAGQGMTVVLSAMFTYSLSTSGGPLDFAVWSSANYQAYGAAVGARYAATANLIWVMGDDYFGGSPGGTYDTPFTSFLTGLRGAGANQLISIENQWEGDSRISFDGTVTNYVWGTAHAQFQWCYGYTAAYNLIEPSYLEASPLCVVHMDGWYDNQRAISESTELFMRKLVWWSLSSGSRGFMYGNNDLWYWPVNAISGGLAGGSPGPSYMQPAALNTIWNSFAALHGWHQLVPDTTSALVTAGRGTKLGQFASGGTSFYTGGNTYVSAGKTADSTLAVIYIPGGGTITVNGAVMASGYGAKWMDPASGAQTTATIASTYTTPGTNSAGDPDWLLVLAIPPYATWAVP